jgi:hypothetical protein
MNNLITFQTSYITKSKVKPETIWRIWEDVNNWPLWDTGLHSTQLLTEFKKGETFLLTPQGSPFPIKLELKEVIKNEKFIEFACLPYGTIEVCNEMVSVNDMTTITHLITATINKSESEIFSKTLWKTIEEGVAQSIENAIALAEKTALVNC